ncbi:MAG: hypothetical protein ABEK50_08790 [bacterium]
MNETKQTDQATQSEASGEACGWQEGSTGILAGLFAAVCCTFPPLLAALGLTGLAGVLSAMPFAYHLVLQWVALGFIAIGWWLFFRAWFRFKGDARWSWPNITTGVIMVLATVYVLKTFIGHMLLMPKAPF